MSKLFNTENSDCEDEILNINTDYANNYDNWRKKEELHKLQARYGENVKLDLEVSDEQSSSSEEDEGTNVPEQFEKDFYKTLACLKSKNPKIYEENIKFFKDENEKKDLKNKKKKEKPLSLRDYERKIITEKGGKFSDESEDEDKFIKQKPAFTYVEEQKQIKDSFKNALQDSDAENESDTGLLKPKSKTTEELTKEEEEYKEWLKGQKKDIDAKDATDLQPLRDYWSDPNLDSGEKFLRDYILNNKFLENDDNNAELDYDLVAHDSDNNLSEDERNIDKQEEFEHKYNFRFEEPDQEFIKRYPRTLDNVLRKKNTKRAEKRAVLKERKAQEKIQKQEELKQLKALKRKEIEEKISQLKEITGNNDLKFDMFDLEGDFDPNEHDKKMSELFNDDYYAEEKGDVKPEFPDIDEVLQIENNWDDYDPNNVEFCDANDEAPHCEDQDFNMDADYNKEDFQKELVESTRRKKKRRKSKFAEMIQKEKPKFDPALYSSYKEYFDQYYALDYEDMIGDIPCRFKYRNVVPNDYGLTMEEILMADDRELNKWCSLKKALQHKSEHVELNEVKTYKHKAANEGLKRKILNSIYGDPEEGTQDEAVENKKKRKRKKKNQGSQETEAMAKEKNNAFNEVGQQGNKKQIPPSSVKVPCTEDIPEEVPKKKDSLQETEDGNGHQGKRKKKNPQNQTVQNSKPTTSEKKDGAKAEFKMQNKKDRINNRQKWKNNDNYKLSKNNDKDATFKKLQKQVQKEVGKDQITSMSAERLKAYGLNPKKFLNKLKYKNKTDQISSKKEKRKNC